jgi:hypothetical protein
MKTKIFISVLLIVIIPVLYFLIWTGFNNVEEVSTTKALIPASANPSKNFITCIYNNDYYGINTQAKWSIKDNLPRYKYELNFNSIQISGGPQGGAFDDAISSYSTGVNGLMSDIDTSGLMTLYGRQKLEKLCFGQRVEYEAEGGNNGFSYQRRYADIITDSGRSVLHPCISNCDATPRILCDSIYENIQHSNIIADYFSSADAGNWFLKPVMRIDSSVAHNNPTVPVIAIVTKNFSGETSGPNGNKDSLVIRARNFLDSSTQNYNGKYLENYSFLAGDKRLNVSGNVTDGLNKGRDDNNLDLCKVDFKIYWLGQVEVWFDKLIVDDEMGNNLFNADTSVSHFYERKITEEIDAFKSSNFHRSNYAYYVDEMVYANIPCVKRVVELMKSVDTNARLNCATTNYLNTRGMRNDTLAYRVFMQTLNPELFSNDAHEITGLFPNNLTLLESQFNQVAVSSSISAYQNEQQRKFGDKYYHSGDYQGSLIYQIELARNQRNIYAPNAQFIMQPQLHAFFIHHTDNTNPEWEGIREP